jgi:predicted transcriptional regulator
MKTELTPAMQRRLAKLATAAGRTPAEMLPYVMKDGFEYTEDFIRKVNEGIAQADAGEVIPHEEVMAQIQATIAAARDKHKKAA